MAFGNIKASIDLFNEGINEGKGRIKSFKDAFSALIPSINWLSVGIGVAVTAISLIVNKVKEYKQELKDLAKESAEQAEKSASYVESLIDLQNQLEEGKTSTEDLTSAFREQMRAMGKTEDEIDTLIGKYNNLAGAIDEATREALENAKTDAYADMASSGNSLIVEAKGKTTISTNYSQNEELSNEIRKMLGNSPAILDGGVFRMDKNASASDIYEYYLVLKDISRLIQETASETGDESLLSGDALNPTPYYQVSEALSALAESAGMYGDAISRLHSADAQLELADYLKTNDINTQEEFDSYIEGIKNSTTYSEAYKQVLLEVANDAFPQFSSAVSSMGDLGNEMSIPSLEELHSNLDAIQDAYDTVASAIEEYNKQGYLSVDTYQSLMELEPQYLQYLMDEEGNLRLGTDAMNDYTSALIDNMAMKKMESIVDYINTLSAEERQLYLTKDATDEASASLVDFAASLLQDKIALNELSEDELEGLKSMMSSVASWAESAKAGLGKGGLGSGSSGSSSSKEFSETIDFFEERVENLNDVISLLDKNLENVSGSFAKNKLISAEIDLNAEKMNNYSSALAMYSQKASEALSSIPTDLRDRVVNGAVAINDFVGEGNEAVVDAIKEYQKWSDKISDCQQELAELKEAIRDLELEKFNNIMDDFQSQFDIRENSKSLIDKQIDLFREAGELIGESFYSEQIEQSQKQLQILEQEKAALTEHLTSALASGNIERGTDEWLEMVNSLTELDGQIIDCKKSIEEFDNAILDLHTEIFERIQNEFSNLNSELENLGGLFEDFDVANSDGAWSKEGLARLGLLSQQYELARYQVEQYNEEIAKLNEDYANGKYSAIEYSERLADLSEKQWDAVNSAESMKDAIIDLNKQRVDIQIEGIEKEISAYESLIQSKIDALDAEKELNDYRASISDKNKSITDIERQLAAMEGDNTASTIAKRKKLEQELADAKTDLERTQYDHSVEMQKEALDKELERFTEEKDAEIKKLEESLEDQETLIYNSMESVKENSAIIGQEIENIAKKHGVSISKSITNSWKNGEKAIASYGSVLSAQSSAFIGELVMVEVETYNLQAQANVTASSLANMFGTRADNLVSQLTESYYSEANLYNMTNALQNSLRSTLEGGYDVSGITSALNSITDAANKAKYAVEDLGTTPKLPPNESITIQTGQGSTGTKNNKGNSLSSVTISKYASGTRSTNGNLFVKNEEGYELMLPKLTSGDYTIAPEGSQILTKAQTDNIFDWSKINPDVLIPQSIRSNIGNIGLPSIVNKATSTTPSLHLDKFIHIDKVDSTNIKQMESIANKAVNDLVNKMYNGVKYKS